MSKSAYVKSINYNLCRVDACMHVEMLTPNEANDETVRAKSRKMTDMTFHGVRIEMVAWKLLIYDCIMSLI